MQPGKDQLANIVMATCPTICSQPPNLNVEQNVHHRVMLTVILCASDMDSVGPAIAILNETKTVLQKSLQIFLWTATSIYCWICGTIYLKIDCVVLLVNPFLWISTSADVERNLVKRSYVEIFQLKVIANKNETSETYQDRRLIYFYLGYCHSEILVEMVAVSRMYMILSHTYPLKIVHSIVTESENSHQQNADAVTTAH